MNKLNISQNILMFSSKGKFVRRFLVHSKRNSIEPNLVVRENKIRLANDNQKDMASNIGIHVIKSFLPIKSQVDLLALVMPYKQLARVEQTRYYEESRHSPDERLIESDNFIFGGHPYRKRLIAEETPDLTQHTKSVVDPDWGYGTDFNIDNVPLLLHAIADCIQCSADFDIGDAYLRDIAVNYASSCYFGLPPHIDPIDDGEHIFIIGANYAIIFNSFLLHINTFTYNVLLLFLYMFRSDELYLCDHFYP